MDDRPEADAAVTGKPLVVFDGACAFCRIWIEYFKKLTAGRFEFAPYREVAASHPRIEIARFQQAVHLIQPSGEAFSGARAVFEILPSPVWLTLYRRLPGFAALSEAAYRFVAGRRNLFYRLTLLFLGNKIEPLRYDGVEWVFLRMLAVIYLIAFGSFGIQAAGLIGSHGILPAARYLARISEAVGALGYRLAPTLFWLGSRDWMLTGACIAGVVSALLILFGVFRRAALCAAFVLYLSLVNVSQEFLSYQWDFLLLETGFLAIFLGYSRWVIWLFRWLLFRLMFFSGAVKLLSGDPTWHNLTALTFHYQTQPIPTPLAWYAHHLPLAFQKFSCAGVFSIELLVPLFILGPRRARWFALPWLVALQLMILLTGNYAFFNLLAISLCIFLLDDGFLRRLFAHRTFPPRAPLDLRGKAGVWVLAAFIAILSGLPMIHSFSGSLPPAARALAAAAAPFGIVNSYGLFANMTTSRLEIVVEGSNDGSEWRGYEFKYKPGRLDRRPPWVAPYQPRLDWQMWFASLGSYRENVWFLNFLARLLQGRPEVLRLIESNPFPDRPPRFVRAQVFEYRFTQPAHTREWWTRSPAGVYVPPVSLASLSSLDILQGAPDQQ